MTRRVVAITMYGVAMAFLEAAVVVYLRALYYPRGFSFPIVLIPEYLARIELLREAATLVMLGAVAYLAGASGWERLGYFAYAFGVWDLFYYVWLKWAIGWPASLLTWDLLFLIPVPWSSPVLAPVVVSVCLMAGGMVLIHRERSGRFTRPAAVSWLLAAGGGVAVLGSFLANWEPISRSELPGSFSWAIFALGVASGWIGFALALRGGDGDSGSIAGRIRV